MRRRPVPRARMPKSHIEDQLPLRNDQPNSGGGSRLRDLDTEWGRQYPGVIDVWRRAWNEFIPFLDYPAELRRVVYTTNAIESINFQLRKVTKTRGHFPSDEAAMKLLYLGLRNISSKRGGESGTGTWGWKMALNTLVVLFPGRLPL
jgi:putative transposase